MLYNRQDLDLALTSLDVDADILSMASDEEVDRPFPHAEVRDADLLQERREERVRKADQGGLAANRQSQTGLQEEKNGGGRPGLRGTGDRIGCRALSRT